MTYAVTFVVAFFLGFVAYRMFLVPKNLGRLVITTDPVDGEKYFIIEIPKSALNGLKNGEQVCLTAAIDTTYLTRK